MIVSLWMHWFKGAHKGLATAIRDRERPRGRTRSRAVVSIEPLEGRELLATVGVDYALSGFRWTNPAHITFSFAPDGVFWDRAPNTLNSAFNTKFGAGVWQREAARALATWQASANLNIGFVGDSHTDLDSLGQEQSDPRFGDIRFGGYAFPNTTTTLAQTYFPPPNGATAAGDVEVNTALNYNVGSDYDLYSVMLHETGHSLGLDHPSNASEVMYTRYGGARSGLSVGDLAGIRALYGARVPDVYQRQGIGTTFAGTIDLTSSLNATGAGVLGGVSLDTIGDTEYFSVIAPAGASGGFHVTAATAGLSLLSPRVTLFDASGRALASEADPAAWGNNVNVTAASVVPGQRYVVAVTGATSDEFSVGAYILAFSFDGVTPVGNPPAPDNPNPNPAQPGFASSPDRFESNDTFAQASPLGIVTRVVVGGLSLHDAGDDDDFSFRSARSGVYVVSAPGANLRIVDALGRALAQGHGQVIVRVPRARMRLFIEVTAAGQAPLADYRLSVALQPAAAVTSRRTPKRESTPRAPVSASVPLVHPNPQSWPVAWSRGRAALAGARPGR